jgi:hypothetical protein
MLLKEAKADPAESAHKYAGRRVNLTGRVGWV